MPFKVFISHGKEDTWIASQVSRLIKDCGVSTFLDEADISPGDNFIEVIHQEINQSQELVVLFTPWSARRAWLWIEVGAAWGQNKRIIAVLHGLEISKLEKFGGSKAVFENIQIIKLNDFEKYLSELKKRVTEL